MPNFCQRVILPALLLTWALSHATVFGGDPKGEPKRKDARDQPAIERIRKALDLPIVLDFSGQSLMEVLMHLREKSQVEFNIDQVGLAMVGVNVDAGAGEPIVVKSNGGKLSAALRKLLAGQQLTYVIFEDSVLITTPELATQRQMRQRVNLDLDEVPLAKAVRDLGRNYAFNVVIDPRVTKQAQRPVSLTLDGASLETGVRLLAELADLKAVRLDNVLFVTTEERADKLRKEEKDMQPNQLDDTNNLGGLRAAVAGNPNLILGNIGINGPAFRPVPLPAKEANEPAK
jgi:hypothetical protein